MAVAIAWIRIALNRCVERNRHRPGIAFVTVSGEVNHHRHLRGRYHNVGDADGLIVVQSGAEVRMQWLAAADEVDDGRGVGIDLCAGDVGVPQAVGGEGNEAVQAAFLSQGKVAARIGLS